MIEKKRYHVYIGTYTDQSLPGIWQCSYDSRLGTLKSVDRVSGILNPSYLTVDEKHNRLYAVSESAEGRVVAFDIEGGTGKLSYRNTQSTLGGAPCHLTVDHEGKYLFVVNYMGGNVCLFPILSEGNIGNMSDNVRHYSNVEQQGRQEAHPHSAIVDPTNQFVVVSDLGLDKIIIYKLNREEHKLTFNDEVMERSGSGPRHFVFHPFRKYAYVMNELTSTITAFTYNAEQGSLGKIQTVSALPDSFTGESYGADIHVAPNGKFLYASNRGHDSIAVFKIDEESGVLTNVEYTPTNGRTPRNFAIAPDGNFLLVANQDSDSIVSFKIDQHTGRLKQTDNVIQITKPVCIKFGSVIRE
ncbi:lactonase family protein [Novibacillus thermophilus]|uniref:6-phosphogluconolactonase n=1 Tax=Novibacillus thermophilus TaxID=1471761 RepID=A0A1U9K4N2_9BACL|nr:lactonase family protein [Novibacillus thermophilus]AQS55009.1 hypothetical protein B0W44_03720 [Novibacillus thermophilus]